MTRLLLQYDLSPVCNSKIAGSRPNMNIKVAAYDMTYLQDNNVTSDIMKMTGEAANTDK